MLRNSFRKRCCPSCVAGAVSQSHAFGQVRSASHGCADDDVGEHVGATLA